jgi:hypothetical protein
MVNHHLNQRTDNSLNSLNSTTHLANHHLNPRMDNSLNSLNSMTHLANHPLNLRTDSSLNNNMNPMVSPLHNRHMVMVLHRHTAPRNLSTDSLPQLHLHTVNLPLEHLHMDKHHTDNPRLNPRTDKIHLNRTVNIVKERQATASRIPVEGILPSTPPIYHK